MILSDQPAHAGSPPLRIEVVEPTLVSEAGHCAALFRGLQAAAPDLPFRLWIDRAAALPGWNTQRAQLAPHFYRRWRKWQAYWLYRRLLRAPAPVLVPTATYLDLRSLDLAAPGPLGPGRAYLYFHKLRVSARRQQALGELARRQPHLELFGTSEEIVARLRAAGFARVHRVLPVLSSAAPARAAQPFRRLLSAGAARADKGFTHIVELVELLERSGSTLPIAVQTSGDHYGRHDEQTTADLERLRRCRYPQLELLPDTLDAGQYAALFPGAICLQPYAPGEYADKMSAVTFDALRAGAPVITLAGTTMARIVAQSGAGVVLAQAQPEALLQAASTVVARYPELGARALAAGQAYAPDTSWAPLVEALRSGLHGTANPK